MRYQVFFALGLDACPSCRHSVRGAVTSPISGDSAIFTRSKTTAAAGDPFRNSAGHQPDGKAEIGCTRTNQHPEPAPCSCHSSRATGSDRRPEAISTRFGARAAYHDAGRAGTGTVPSTGFGVDGWTPSRRWDHRQAKPFHSASIPKAGGFAVPAAGDEGARGARGQPGIIGRWRAHAAFSLMTSQGKCVDPHLGADPGEIVDAGPV